MHDQTRQRIPTYRSRFGGLWIDRDDADSLLASKLEHGAISHDLSDLIRIFMRDGYVVIKSAVSKHLIPMALKNDRCP